MTVLPDVERGPSRGFDRRTFLRMVGGGIVVLVTLGPDDLFAQGRRAYPEDLNAYLLIGADGRVTVFTGKIEMGQGVMTSQAQMAADELGVALSAIDMVMGDTDRCPWDAGTCGSLTTRMFGPVLRAAAAEARLVLLGLAAAQLGVPRAELDGRRRRRLRRRRPEPEGHLRASSPRGGRSPGWSARRRCSSRSGSSRSWAARPSGSTAAPRSPAPRSTPATSGGRGCSTRGSSVRRRTARS